MIASYSLLPAELWVKVVSHADTPTKESLLQTDCFLSEIVKEHFPEHDLNRRCLHIEKGLKERRYRELRAVFRYKEHSQALDKSFIPQKATIDNQTCYTPTYRIQVENHQIVIYEKTTGKKISCLRKRKWEKISFEKTSGCLYATTKEGIQYKLDFQHPSRKKYFKDSYLYFLGIKLACIAKETFYLLCKLWKSYVFPALLITVCRVYVVTTVGLTASIFIKIFLSPLFMSIAIITILGIGIFISKIYMKLG